METYTELYRRHQKEFNDTELGAAFSKKQFKEMLDKLGASGPEDLVSLGSGVYLHKKNIASFREMRTRHALELEEAKKADTDGSGFLLEMFLYELRNNEYGYTYDATQTLDALGYSPEDLKTDPILGKAFRKARALVLQD